MVKTKPNLFEFATSELSQDAFIAWLLDWANPSYKSEDFRLHQIAFRFVKLLLEKTNSFEVKSVKVERQWNNIDVVATINDEKKGTATSSSLKIRNRQCNMVLN